jgi:ABC-type transport system involved in multi-copper enzyme maturation permease subunit
LRADDPGLPRTLGMIGAALVIFSGMGLWFGRIGVGWGTLTLATGVAGLLFHAAFDRDVQFRRLYLGFAYATLAVGVFLSFYPYPAKAGDQFRYAVPCASLALLFFLAFLRNEDDPFFRRVAQFTLGAAGLVMALVGLLGGNVRGDFLLPYGLVLGLLGLVYLVAFVSSRGVSDDLAYRAALGVGLLGLLVLVIALVRSFLPPPKDVVSYFQAYGVLLLGLGLLYALVAAALCSDHPLVVLTRRELGAFFFSPIAYLCLFGFCVASWTSYQNFLDGLINTERGNPPFEPIIRNYLFALFPVIVLIFVVPVLTMRLLSEEYSTGTLEVLLTAPVGDGAVVLSKFLAALITYLAVWLPFGLFLLAIPLAGGNPFDYRPLYSFGLAVLITGAGFVSMGLFFSSLTRSQIASAVLTFVGMMALTLVSFMAWQEQNRGSTAWEVSLSHLSYLQVWQNTLEGKITPKNLLFYPALTVLCLFLTVKVLESRRWR